jgi:hypothetical protein
MARLSRKNVAFIEINPMPSQQIAVFLLERPSPMVLFLRVDILQNSYQLTRTNRKSTVSSLPEKPRYRGSRALIHFEDVFLISSINCACETVRGKVVRM